MTDTLAIAVRDLPWLRLLAGRLARGDADVADDLVQETLERAWHVTAAQGDPAAPRGWLATVLRNRLRMTLRAGARRTARESQIHATRPTNHDPTDELARLELLGIVVERLNALPELDRRIVMLRYFDELDATAIGERLAMTPSTVRSRLRRALADLRDEMDARCGDRRAWALLLGAPPRTSPSTTSVVGTITAMSTATKLAVIAAVALAATAVWISGREGPSLARATVASVAVPRAEALALGRDDRTGTAAARTAAPLRDQAPLRRSLATSPLPVPEAGAIDEAGLVAEGKAALAAAFEICRKDLAPDGPPPTKPGATYWPGHEPEHPFVGRLVIRATMVGSPDVGTMFDSVTVVEATEPGGALVECVVQSAYAYVGPLPASDLESPVMWGVLGHPPADVGDEAWRQQMFEGVMLAYVPEGVQACDPDSKVAGVLRFELDFVEGPGASDVRVAGSDIPEGVLACIRAAAESWMFPRKFAGRTMAHVVTLPIERDAIRDLEER